MSVWSVNPRNFSDSVNKDVINRDEATRERKARIRFELSHGLDVVNQQDLIDKFGQSTVATARRRKVVKDAKDAVKSAKTPRTGRAQSQPGGRNPSHFPSENVNIFNPGGWSVPACRPSGPIVGCRGETTDPCLLPHSAQVARRERQKQKNAMSRLATPRGESHASYFAAAHNKRIECKRVPARCEKRTKG